MHIKNTSKYPTSEVKKLVEFGMRHFGFDHSKLVVVVKNCNRGAGRGSAYRGVPFQSPFRGKGYNWLITIGIGDQKYFPITNTITKRTRKYLTPWVKTAPDGKAPRRMEKSPWGGYYAMDVHWLLRMNGSKMTWGGNAGGGNASDSIEYRFYKTVVTKHPYGGKKSPLLTYNNWQEMLVAVAAHEAQHIEQYVNETPTYEWECETVSGQALDDYRTFRAAEAA